MVPHALASFKRGDGGLFTLRESRRGQSEARGQETGRSVSRKHPTPGFQKPRALERREVQWHQNDGIQGDGMEPHEMECKGME